jgi:putative addiction module killer protein
MKTIRRTDEFDQWLDGLKDRRAAGRIVVAMEKLSFDLGDVAPVGEGVSELRLHFGAGYRLYFVGRGRSLIVMLGGGDKGSQSKDIKEAKRLAKLLE